MRQLKFRAWNGEQMVSPDYITRSGSAWWKENSIPTYSNDIMQFTGLCDCDGREIYEGDLVSNNFLTDKEVIREIKFINCQWIAEKVRGKSRLPDKIALFDYYLSNFKVIGNIYENPELLNDTISNNQ